MELLDLTIRSQKMRGANEDKRRQAIEQSQQVMFLILQSQQHQTWVKGIWQVSMLKQFFQKREGGNV